jgi:competence protein ComEA
MKRLFLALVMSVAFGAAAGAAVNINTATKEELTSLKGIGSDRAQDIIDYRTKNGPFKTVDDLQKVPGIGPGFMKRIRSQISTTGKTVIETPAGKATKSKASAARTEPAKGDGLKSDKASNQIAEKWTTGTKTQKKKSN